MKNAFSVDLEDWFCAIGDIFDRSWEECESRIENNTLLLLSILDRHKVKATFFILGWIAERFPELIRKIRQEGHEIASHGYSHRDIDKMTPEEFESDLKRSLKIIEGCTNQPVIGFRAPRFNVTRQTLWLFEILERNGIKYDSSIFPLSLFSTYNSRTISLEPYKLTPYLWEFPLSCIRFGKIRLPCSGGIFFRAFPYGYTKLCIKRINNSNNPAIFYIHPWELDYQHPYINLPKMRQLRHYYNLKKTEARLERLLSDFEFTTVKNILKL